MKRKDYWPCIPVIGRTRRSIVFTHLYRLGKQIPDAGGNDVKALIKSRVDADVVRRVKFKLMRETITIIGDPASLLVIAKMLRKAIGQRLPSPSVIAAQLTPDEASHALRLGYIEQLDRAEQRKYLRGWGCPPDAIFDRIARGLASSKRATRLESARRLRRATESPWSTNVHAKKRDVLTGLEHPARFEIVLDAARHERDPAIADVLLVALSAMCARLPHLGTRALFERSLSSPREEIRRASVDGLSVLCTHDWSKLLPLLADPAEQVRVAVCQAAWRSTRCHSAATPMYKESVFPREHRSMLQAMLNDKACHQYASNALEYLAG